jgi:hypothetical protein
MFEFFSSLTFLQPLALFATIAAPTLILAYLMKDTRKKVAVSSVMLLKGLNKKATLKRKIKLPPNFFFEFLALLLLAIAAAMPAVSDKSENVAILFDNSLSMSAKNPTQDPFPDRLSEAKKLLKGELSGKNNDATYQVYQAAPKVRVLSETELSLPEALATADSIEVSLSAVNIPAAVAEIVGLGKFDRIVVVTDQVVNLVVEPRNANSTRTEVEVVSVNKPVKNFFFRDISLSKQNDGKNILLGQLSYSGDDSVDVEVLLKAQRFSAKTAPSEEILLAKKNLSLEPEHVSEVSFLLPAKTGDLNIFSLEATSSSALSNAITADDKAWVNLGESSHNRLLFVSDELADPQLASVPGISLDKVNSNQFSKLLPDDLSRYSLLIFHKISPARMPNHSSLFVIPPAGGAIFTPAALSNSPRVTSWANEHPITAYLRLPLLSLSTAEVLETPPWAQSIINSETGSLLLAGESRGIKFAAVGFELFPFEGKKTPITSILTLNLFSWLTGGGEIRSSIYTGSEFHYQTKMPLILISKGGSEKSFDNSKDNRQSVLLTSAGPYAYRPVDNRQTDAGEFVVNTFFPDESDTFQRQVINLAQSFAKETSSRESTKALWPTILWAVLVLLLIEFLMRVWLKQKAASVQTSQEIAPFSDQVSKQMGAK